LNKPCLNYCDRYCYNHLKKNHVLRKAHLKSYINFVIFNNLFAINLYLYDFKLMKKRFVKKIKNMKIRF